MAQTVHLTTVMHWRGDDLQRDGLPSSLLLLVQTGVVHRRGAPPQSRTDGPASRNDMPVMSFWNPCIAAKNHQSMEERGLLEPKGLLVRVIGLVTTALSLVRIVDEAQVLFKVRQVRVLQR